MSSGGRGIVSPELTASRSSGRQSGPSKKIPLIVHDHGGQAAGADFQRLSQLPVHETLASHGFVVAVGASFRECPEPRSRRAARHRCDAGAQRNPGDFLFRSIDRHRIGISGESTGGGTALRVAGGWSENGIAADPRIKAMVVYEPAPFSDVDVSTISLPYLVMGGTQSAISETIPSLFDTTVLATPRIYVTNPRAVHISYQTGICSRIDETREAALMANPAQPEPLDNLTTLPSGLRACSPALSAAAAAACLAWNMGEITSPTSPGFGGGRNFCTRVGVNSIASLDSNPADGFTDSPPFTATDAFTFKSRFPGNHGVHDQALYRRILADVPGAAIATTCAISRPATLASPPAGGFANSALVLQATCLSTSTFPSSTEASLFEAAA